MIVQVRQELLVLCEAFLEPDAIVVAQPIEHLLRGDPLFLTHPPDGTAGRKVRALLVEESTGAGCSRSPRHSFAGGRWAGLIAVPLGNTRRTRVL